MAKPAFLWRHFPCFVAVSQILATEAATTLIRLLIICLFSYIPSGVFDILVGGQKVGAYDNKGSFGELALMYNMPRAATIIATTTGTLWGMVRYSYL